MMIGRKRSMLASWMALLSALARIHRCRAKSTIMIHFLHNTISMNFPRTRTTRRRLAKTMNNVSKPPDDERLAASIARVSGWI